MKVKTIKLTDGWGASHPDGKRRFRVEQITDSIEFETGQLLERAEVEGLCRSDKWKVTIASKK